MQVYNSRRGALAGQEGGKRRRPRARGGGCRRSPAARAQPEGLGEAGRALGPGIATGGAARPGHGARPSFRCGAAPRRGAGAELLRQRIRSRTSASPGATHSLYQFVSLQMIATTR